MIWSTTDFNDLHFFSDWKHQSHFSHNRVILKVKVTVMIDIPTNKFFWTAKIYLATEYSGASSCARAL